jgi:hypothetical protein
MQKFAASAAPRHLIGPQHIYKNDIIHHDCVMRDGSLMSALRA